MPILEIDNLRVNYGSIEALKGVSVSVEEGSTVALLGANGAGKSTTLKKISGLLEAASGTVRFMGRDITKTAAHKITAMGVVHSPEGRQVFRDLTVLENLKIGAFTVKGKGKIKESLKRVYRYFPVLEERSSQISSTLSGGEQQMLAIGRALMSAPKLLMMDEPSLGLAPIIVSSIFEIIKEIRRDGTTVLIVEQNALQTLKIADYAYVLETGSIRLEGNPKELLDNPYLVEAYIGDTTGSKQQKNK